MSTRCSSIPLLHLMHLVPPVGLFGGFVGWGIGIGKGELGQPRVALAVGMVLALGVLCAGLQVFHQVFAGVDPRFSRF